MTKEKQCELADMPTEQIVSTLVKDTKSFHDKIVNQPNSRFLSWEHCYKAFYDARKSKKWDSDNLCLHLAFYLASWGMYRGSSFLLQRDFLVHKPAVELIMISEYDELQGASYDVIINKNELLKDLIDELKRVYNSIRESVYDEAQDNPKAPDTDVSDTLITKILLGTLGCTPAFDRYFKAGVHCVNISVYNISNSIKALSKFYNTWEDEFENLRKEMVIQGSSYILYPQMKLLDMAFWYHGYHYSNDGTDSNTPII